MTEMSPVTHMDSQDPARVRYGTVGHCIPNTECKLVSTEDGSELGKNQDGELWIRGPQAMRGYLNNPEASAACLNDEGWYHSGDVARVDDDGYFHIVDRVKELIKYKGMQVAPAELEAILLTHPAIADAAVIPSPDEEAGEIPKAFVVLKSEISADEIIAFVAERVAPHKKIRRVDVVEQIPKSASGKILRRILIDQERQQRAG
jgi:acyl-CoA synthetase (AMP-forming)/AMP-acid ligase II